MTHSSNDSTAMNTTNDELQKILTRQNGLHGIQHQTLGGKNLAFEYCLNCKATVEALTKYITEQSILSLFQAHLKELKSNLPERLIEFQKFNMLDADSGYRKGYNEALKDVEKVIDQYLEGMRWY